MEMVPPLKAASDREAIETASNALAGALRAARPQAQIGDVFAPDIVVAFRQRIDDAIRQQGRAAEDLLAEMASEASFVLPAPGGQRTIRIELQRRDAGLPDRRTAPASRRAAAPIRRRRPDARRCSCPAHRRHHAAGDRDQPIGGRTMPTFLRRLFGAAMLDPATSRGGRSRFPRQRPRPWRSSCSRVWPPAIGARGLSDGPATLSFFATSGVIAPAGVGNVGPGHVRDRRSHSSDIGHATSIRVNCCAHSDSPRRRCCFRCWP